MKNLFLKFKEFLCKLSKHKFEICWDCRYPNEVQECSYCPVLVSFEKEFIDDDFVFQAYASSSGDMCCLECCKVEEAEEENQLNDYDEIYQPTDL